MPKPVPATKVPNYTGEQEEILKARYPANPTRETVDEIAREFRKTPRSIIAKLSNMGIYVTPPRTTKAGTPIVKKETLVSEISSMLGVEVPSLVKSNKQDLEKTLKSLHEWFGEPDEGTALEA